MTANRLFFSILSFVTLTACSSLPPDPDSNLGGSLGSSPRGIAAQADRRESYNHGGQHNFNSATPLGTKVIETTQKEDFKRDLSTFKDPRAVSENYEYQTNREDILARHTFVLAGADRKLGHHVAFFESRHQHHALVKLDFDFTGTGLKPEAINPKDLAAGKTLFETKILKEGSGAPTLPKGEYYAVQVSPLNPEFELVTIPTGITQKFLGSFSTINGAGKVTRFNPKGADVIVRITGVYHFSRLYTSETADDLQYMIFSANDPKEKSRVILAHLIRGNLPEASNGGTTNVEQMLEAEILSPRPFAFSDGAVLQIQNHSSVELLQPDSEVDAVLTKGGATPPPNATQNLKLKIKRDVYNRQFGIDPSQEAVRERLRNGRN